jgi:hypothetical protein
MYRIQRVQLIYVILKMLNSNEFLYYPRLWLVEI